MFSKLLALLLAPSEALVDSNLVVIDGISYITPDAFQSIIMSITDNLIYVILSFQGLSIFAVAFLFVLIWMGYQFGDKILFKKKKSSLQ